MQLMPRLYGWADLRGCATAFSRMIEAHAQSSPLSTDGGGIRVAAGHGGVSDRSAVRCSKNPRARPWRGLRCVSDRGARSRTRRADSGSARSGREPTKLEVRPIGTAARIATRVEIRAGIEAAIEIAVPVVQALQQRVEVSASVGRTDGGG